MDETGNKVSVILPIEELEELEDIRLHDEAKAEIEREGSEEVPWEEVREKIGSEYEDPEAARGLRGQTNA